MDNARHLRLGGGILKPRCFLPAASERQTLGANMTRSRTCRLPSALPAAASPAPAGGQCPGYPPRLPSSLPGRLSRASGRAAPQPAPPLPHGAAAQVTVSPAASQPTAPGSERPVLPRCRRSPSAAPWGSVSCLPRDPQNTLPPPRAAAAAP